MPSLLQVTAPGCRCCSHGRIGTSFKGLQVCVHNWCMWKGISCSLYQLHNAPSQFSLLSFSMKLDNVSWALKYIAFIFLSPANVQDCRIWVQAVLAGPTFLSYGPCKREEKKSRKWGCRRCADLQQKMAELGKRFHFPGRGGILHSKKKEETKTFSAVTKFCGFMEQVSVRICCEDTEVAAVAWRAGMCFTRAERELQSELWIITGSCLLSFSIFLFSAISFYTKAPLPQPCTHPIDDSSYLSYGLGRDVRDRLVLISIFKCYGNTENMITKTRNN